MPNAVATQEPKRITAGDSLWWDRSLPDYPPADGWSLSYFLSGPHESVIEIQAAANGSIYEVRENAAATASYTPGTYSLSGFASKAADRFRVYSGSVVVDPDPAEADPSTPFAEQMVSRLETAILAAASSGIVEYTIAGPDGQRGVKRVTMKEAREELAYWRRQLNAERGTSPLRRSLAVRFGPV